MHISQHTIRKQDFIRKWFCLLTMLLSFGASFAQEKMEAAENSSITPSGSFSPSDNIEVNDSIVSGDSTLSAARSTRAGEETTTQKYYSIDLYAQQYAGGTGTKDDPYQISSDLELALLAREVNNGTSTAGKYYKLTNNIILNQGLWMPIGTTTNKSGKDFGFQGKFDGDGHSISNMHIVWTNESGLQARWGLFSKLKGTGNNESGYTSVSDLTIEGATVEMQKGFAPKGSTVIKLGVLAGEMNGNAEISNIIIRKSKVTDNEESYTSTCPYRVGGIVGYFDNASYRIYNIDAETEVDMLVNATCKTMVRIAAGFGNVSGFGINNSYSIAPTNIFVHGNGVKTNTKNTQCNVGGVMAFYGTSYNTNSYLPEANRNTLFYTSDNKATGTQPYNIGTVKVYAEFIKDFVDMVNKFIKDKNLDRETWNYSSNNQASFITTSVKVTRGISDELTVVMKDGTTPSNAFYWWVSSDNLNFAKKNAAASTSFTLPRNNSEQYVYAVSEDGSIHTATVVVKPIRVSATLNSKKDEKTGKTTYTVVVTNDTGVSNEELGLSFDYQWYKGTEAQEGQKSASFERPVDAHLSDIYNCHVTAQSGNLVLSKDTLYVTTVVFLDPNKGIDTNDGYTASTAVHTWQKAYSKLNEKGSWDENVIVLMGTSGEAETKTGFNISTNYLGINMLTSEVKETVLFRNTTITGKWKDEEYPAVIQINGSDVGLPLWGDTRFENLTFQRGTGETYNNIYCQYHNLEMGEGIKVTGFNYNAPVYGTLDGAVTNALQIFGGLNNDGRFYPLSTTANIEKFKKAMPHGKEGFSINIKSGFYSCICAGGRQSFNGDNQSYNGIMGTPDMPIKCSINIDIDRKWNDENNKERMVSGQQRKNDYDIGIVLAGNHEGAMIGDVDITVKSGMIARIVNGSLGNSRDITFTDGGTTYHFPANTYMGRANILLDPAKSENNKSEDINGRVIVTELYGGSTGRGQNADTKVNNPFYGYSTITINGGTFKILPENNSKKSQILCGIFGAGAGGMNGIGNDTNYTTDTNIPYWNADKNAVYYGSYSTAKNNLVHYTCHNASDNSTTDVDPTKTNTQIVINGGVFGASSEPIDGIYAGGSGYMSRSLWPQNGTPSEYGGNVYGEKGATVAALTINGGTFYCKNGIFAAGRGTEYYYHNNAYSGTAANYQALAKTYGNVKLNISGGTFHCPIFGGGYGVADSKLNANDSTINTLSDMARLYGQSFVTITGGTFYDNIYGGGDMAVVEYHGDDMATNLVIGDKADIRGSIFAGGNGRKKRIDQDENGNTIADKDVKINNDTRHPERVGKVIGSTSVFFQGSTAQAPSVYGDIYGGGNLAQVNGDTYVNIYAGNLAGQVFGGGKGRIFDDNGNALSTDLYTYADITGNTNVTLAQDFGGQSGDDDGKMKDNFSINVIWNKLWDATANNNLGQFYGWDADVKAAEGETIEADKTRFYKDKKFVNPHNIYGGGNLACKVGTYVNAKEEALTKAAEGTGLATVEVRKGMTPFELLKTQEWKSSYTDNKNPHFSVFGGGYGANTQVGSTNVTVDVEGDYGVYDAEVDDNTEQLARPNKKNKARKSKQTKANSNTRAGNDSETNSESSLPVFDNSKGIPNFTVHSVMGGGYAGIVKDSTLVTVDGQTFIHRVYGGGFGDPNATSEADITGQVEGNAKVYIKGAKIYGDVFGGGAGVSPSNVNTYFTEVARVKGTTLVNVSDDAKVYGKVYGGGDIANVGPTQTDYKADYTIKPSSETTIDQKTGNPTTNYPYSASDYRTFVNIMGGDIYGEVYGGGKGIKKVTTTTEGTTTYARYNELGRINGNTLVHVANTFNDSFSTESFDQAGNNIPYIWNRIYGGCAYGTVDGNTLVHIEGGMLGLNVFGGGYGDVPVIDETTGDYVESSDESVLEQVLGKKYDDSVVTYANILGNTMVKIDGGSYIWNQKADTDGNKMTWLATQANSEKTCNSLDEYKLMVRDIKNAKKISDITNPQAKAALNRIQNDGSTKSFFTLSEGNVLAGSFKKNHNIFGGGNRACNVGTYADESTNDVTTAPATNTGDAIVEINHSPVAVLTDEHRQKISLFDYTTLQGLCWYIASRNTTHPQFSVFGAGYGANTKVGSTQVYVCPGAMIDSIGNLCKVDGKSYRYLCQKTDEETFSSFQKDLYNDYNKVSSDDLKKYYGSTDGTRNDPNTFRRYHISRMAWTLGIPGFTFIDIHGGGFSGYVVGNTYVEADNQLACNNIYGAGLGAQPYFGEKESYTGNTKYDFGSIGGNAKVFIKSGTVSQNVYGGGAGIESAYINNGKINTSNDKTGTLVDFPDMAHVKKTEVHIYGETIDNGPLRVDRTLLIGNVYGGGDVANVGTTEAAADSIGRNDYYEKGQNFTSLVDARGGTLLGHLFAGGNGRTKAECNDYTKVGGIYGNAAIVIDKPGMSYPYLKLKDGNSDGYTMTSLNPSDANYLKHPDNAGDITIEPHAFDRIYGGCENGTIYGNTYVGIHDGTLYNNAFGGGWGDICTITNNGEETQSITSADVTGNTHLYVTGGKIGLTAYWLSSTRFWEPSTIIGGVTYSPQYDPTTQKFKINHNIYGGGNAACTIGKTDENNKLSGGNARVYMEKGLLYETTQVLSDAAQENYNFFASNEWKEVFNKVGSPHFCVFGAGYGENTIVKGNTWLNIEMSERPSIIDSTLNIKPDEEYKHFYSGYSVMDLVGGGYSGKVEGDTHIIGSGGGFCRRVFGGGFYNSVQNTHIDLKAIDCQDIFGGGLMGNVIKSTNITVGQNGKATSQASESGSEGTSSSSGFTNKDIFVHGNIYGGNDVSGYVNINDDNGFFSANTDDSESGTNIHIYGGHIYGDVYGAGNGDYLYALDRKGNTKVTVNEDYPLNPNDPNSETVDLVYTVPMRESMPSYKAASDAAKIVNINSWRPLTNKTEIHIEGVSTSDKVQIDGAVYGGGNSATVMKVQAPATTTQSVELVGTVDINIGSHVNIGSVFMGCNGDALFTATEDNNFMSKFQRLNGSVYDATKELNFADTIDWVNDPSNVSISELYLPTKAKDRPSVYPHLIDLYFQPVEMDIQGALWWKDKLEDCTIGSFYCGGNRGNMNIYPDAVTGTVVNYTFPAELTITQKIVGGCNNANYEYIGTDKKVTHEGGYLLGLTGVTNTNTVDGEDINGDDININTSNKKPYIVLNIQNKFEPTVVNDEAYQGGNVYGGCYQTGTVKGNVTINLKSDMLAGKSKEKLEKSNDLLAKDPAYAALNVYGAGYGMESYVYGNTQITMGENIKCSKPQMDGDKFKPCGVSEESNPKGLGVSANFIYGGGQQGNVIGITNVDILNGHVFRSVTGGSYSGYVWGSTQVKVGYPKYYKTLSTSIYYLKRTDTDENHKNLKNNDNSQTIKQMIYLTEGDLVSQGVFEDMVAVYNRDDNKIEYFEDEPDKQSYFTPVPDNTSTQSVDWDNVNIYIDEAVYGGGYSLAQGSSVLANNTTVLKYTDQYNLGDVNGYGGNTTILVGDNTADGQTQDHITISHQEMNKVKLPKGTDLFGYYYKHYDDNKDTYTYRYISEQDKYFYQGETKPDGQKEYDNSIYEYDSEGGIFGDGHLSYAQGFRCADVTGYGFSERTINTPKYINTFQRLDILRLEDNCFTLLGARDYTTKTTSLTPYSIARVGEIQMIANNIKTVTREADASKGITAASDVLAGFNTPRARNYMGLANNIHYVGAVSSNVAFDDATQNPWRDDTGAIPATGASFNGKSYQAVKQSYIDGYYQEGDNKGKVSIFQKRNDGTAKNMIGIASGYALKIQNAQEVEEENTNNIIDKIYYGPIHGVIEMNLINVRTDEGGGYVYAQNVHKREDGSVSDFLETTGNFVFPYTPEQGRFIVDDCFPSGYDHFSKNDSDSEEEVHYWYVTGFNYYYNARITGYTYKEAMNFYSDNSDGLTVLSGLKAGQKVSVLSWKMRSGHTTASEGSASYSCDLEDRNYKAAGTEGNVDMSGQDVSGKYELRIGASASNEYDEGKGFNAILPMKATSAADFDNSNIKGTTLPSDLKDDAKIIFKLEDKANNSTTDYFNKHLSEKCQATLVLKAPAYETYTDENTNKPLISKVGASEFFTKKDDTYTAVTTGTSLSSGTDYYIKNGLAEEYTKIDPDKIYTKTLGQDDYTQVTNLSNVTVGSTTYYCEIPRYYTYTIYLTIEYVQGPTFNGNITIDNCALPGEMIRLKKDKVTIDADQSFSATGYYWHIGKLKTDSNGKTLLEFDNDTESSKWYSTLNSSNGTNTYKQGEQIDKTRTDLFAGANYDKTKDYLDIPAYYYMNGYGVQLGVTMTGFNQIFPVTMNEDDRLVVHNYHEMDPHKEGVDLHIPDAIERAQTETDFAEPRIYISDQQDLTAFGKFITTDGNDGGKNAQFILQNDLTLPSDYTGGNATFQGTFHGNGHVIQGLKANQTLFDKIGTTADSADGTAETSGNIYNLGLASGKISNDKASTDGKKEHYHCCFEYDKDSPVVYEMDGKVNTGYTADDFKYGKVAYDLNGYYLRALDISKKNTDNADKDALKTSLKEDADLQYIYDYFANGDYQYAHRSDAITGRVTGITYLRTGKDNDQPNYGYAETRHDKSHTIDKARAQNYVAASTDENDKVTPESRSGDYLPLFNDAGNGTEVMNDFLFWGQSLQSTPADYPSTIGYTQNNDQVFCHQNNYMVNRVYRTDGYYGNTQKSKFHYNAYNLGSSSMSTYVHIPTTTAIDFTADDDNATVFHDLNIKEGVTQNLLVYTAANNADQTDETEAYGIVSKALSYDENTQESLIKGHHIVKNADKTFTTPYLHLVERTPEGKNSEGNTCENNDFCVPKEFTVTNRAWYVRKPMYYAEDATGAWEGICLPFTAKKVEASLNGEITHFYGAETSEASDANGINTTTQHHEYWLRGLTTIGTETDGKTAATFMRPGDSSSSSTGTALFTQGYSEKMSNYTFNNSFFVDTYGDRLYNKVDNPYYTQTQEYKDYLPLAANVPYVVRFPGYRYYEFDLSSQFYNNLTGKNAEAQTITFNAYGEKSSESQKSAIGIPITGTMSTAANGYAHQGTFAAKLVASGELYGMNAEGTAFNDASTLQTVMPFRTYISKATQAASSARATSESRTATTPSVIYISEGRSIENINPEVKGDENETGDYLTVRPLGQRRVRIESTYATQLNVYTLSGQLFRVLDVQPGTATYSGFYPAVYIFGRTKVIVK